MEIRYSLHAMQRMKRRHITSEDIKITLQFPERIRRQGKKILAARHIGRGTIEVVFTKGKYIRVITVYWV